MHDGSRLGEANPNPNQSNQVLKVCNNYCTEVSPLQWCSWSKNVCKSKISDFAM